MKEKKQKGKKIRTPVCRIGRRQRKGQRGPKCEAAAFCFKRADVCNFWLDRGRGGGAGGGREGGGEGCREGREGGHRKTSTLGGPARPTCAEVTLLCSTRTRLPLCSVASAEVQRVFFPQLEDNVPPVSAASGGWREPDWGCSTWNDGRDKY